MYEQSDRTKTSPDELRDWFAGLALNGLLSNHEWVHEDQAAERAYALADALLAARDPVEQTG